MNCIRDNNGKSLVAGHGNDIGVFFPLNDLFHNAIWEITIVHRFHPSWMSSEMANFSASLGENISQIARKRRANVMV